ncbi:unnamed protein product [Ilex paraguariensis]|uniref:Protein phosphatase n=1 Tax=Ilex paraguariensis TaxID=185542 RepID=A0ABC8UJ90_9AQUA
MERERGRETTSIERSLKMIAAEFYIPKDNKLKPLGEDTHFIYAEKQTIGVADSVGGWARKGVDAGEYARELMANAVYAVEDQPKSTLGNTDDSPSLAEEFEVVVEARDIVVAGIDGLFDNLHSAETEDIVSVCLRQGNMPELLTWTMSKVAWVKSLEEWTDSPFAMATHDAGIDHRGGKYDDVRVVAACLLSAG